MGHGVMPNVARAPQKKRSSLLRRGFGKLVVRAPMPEGWVPPEPEPPISLHDATDQQLDERFDAIRQHIVRGYVTTGSVVTPVNFFQLFEHGWGEGPYGDQK
jgi:hypothetical protein